MQQGSILNAAKGGGRSNNKSGRSQSSSFSSGSSPSKKKKSSKPVGRTNDPLSETPSRTSAAIQPKRAVSHTPPWNVRSPKEAAKHVEAEKIRRANIQRSLAKTHETEGSSSTIGDPNSNQSVDPVTSPLLSKTFLSTQQKKFLQWKRFRPSDRIDSQRRIGTFFNQTSLAQQLPNNLGVPEIAFIGRSNVGKSSLLNRLSTGRNSPRHTTSASLARVGKTPGATASVNVYALSDRNAKDLIVFTDLPGFGYAKLSKERQEAIIRTTEQYISNRAKQTKTLALGIVLIDIRRKPSEDDRNLIQTLFDMDIPILIVVTKMDKVSSLTQKEQFIRTIQEELDLPQLPLCVSSVTGENCNTLWQIILDACETCVMQMKQRYEVVPELDDESEDEGEEEYDASWFAEMEFEDSDDLVYDQGYDWNNADDLSDGIEEELEDNDDDRYNEDNYLDATITSSPPKESLQPPPTRVTLRSLRRRVKKMQKRGEIYPNPIIASMEQLYLPVAFFILVEIN